MALVSNYTNKTESLLGTTSSIQSSLLSTKKSINNINKVFEKRTRIRSTIFQRRKTLNDRKLEALRRREQKDAQEASKVSINTGPNPFTRIQKSGKSFLGRILDFVASVAIGWVLTNLPTWIKWGQAFAKRVRDLWSSLSGFVNAAFNVISSFGNTAGDLLKQVITLDFASIPGTLDKNLSELEKNINDMNKQFEEGFSLFSQPLFDESEIKPTDVAQPSAQEQSGVSVPTGSQGTGRTYYSEGGEKLVDFGGKDYGYYRPGAIGSRGSARVHGAGGQRGHTGEDYAMPVGTPLTMIAKGTVVDTGNDPGGYGLFVVIQLDTGEYVKLAHLSSINVKKGEKVGAGTGPNGTSKVVAFSGNTGLSTGAHLHLDYSKRYDASTAWAIDTMDPAAFINGGGLVKGKNVKSTGEVKEPAQVSAPPTASGQPSQPQQSLVPGAPAPSGGTLSTEQLVALAKQVGFNQQNAVIAAAVAKAESGGRSGVVNDNPRTGDLSYGLWQINMIGNLGPARLKQFGITSYEQLKDPLTNAKAAYILSGGSNFSPWSVYKSGKYQSFLPEAQKAAGVSPAQFTSAQQSNVPGAITPSKEGEVVFAEFPTSGVSVPSGMEGSFGGYGSGGGGGMSQMPGPSSKSDSELLNSFIKKRLLVELAYL